MSGVVLSHPVYISAFVFLYLSFAQKHTQRKLLTYFLKIIIFTIFVFIKGVMVEFTIAFKAVSYLYDTFSASFVFKGT